jgi:nicotinate-nucleotide--dimethylbenzimidazole phosphoribosyltransferase
VALDRLGLEPFLDWSLRLGEGTGALLMFPMLDAAAALLKDVATLDDVMGQS